MNAKDLTILVYDNSEFSSVAQNLSQYFKRTLFYSRWEGGFTNYGAKNIGVGLPGIERVNEPDAYEDEVDIFFFTDLNFMGTANRLKKNIQNNIVSEGSAWKDKRVWGSGDFEMVERNRHTFYDLCVEAGLDVPPTKFFKGFESLMAYLKGKEKLYVKITEYRGSGETFEWVDDRFNEPFINELKRKIGPGMYDKELEFMVQEPVESELEWGVDTYLVDSEFPEYMYMGFENKCESYFCKMESVTNLPKDWQDVMTKFSKVIKKYHYTGQFSMEVRIGKDGKQYFIDPCNRCPYPATCATLYNTHNYGAVIVNALYDNKTTKIEGNKYGAEIVVRTSITNNWVPIYIDKGFEDKVMLCNNVISKLDGTNFRCPPEQLYEDSMKYCSPVGGGSTLEKAIQEATDAYAAIKSKGLEASNTMLADAKHISEQLQTVCNYKF